MHTYNYTLDLCNDLVIHQAQLYVIFYSLKIKKRNNKNFEIFSTLFLKSRDFNKLMLTTFHFIVSQKNLLTYPERQTIKD